MIKDQFGGLWPHWRRLSLSLGMRMLLKVMRRRMWRKRGRLYLRLQPNFTALQIATTDASKLLEEWQKPTPGVQFESSYQMHRNQPIFTFIVFKGCSPDRAGKCNVTADFEMFDPTGKPYGEQKGAQIWVNLPAAPNDNLQLSQAYLGIVIENKDPIGPYEVRTAVTDHIAGITLHTREILTAIP